VLRRLTVRKLKQLCIAAVLTSALSLTAFAGNMDTPTLASPPPLPDQSSVTGDIYLSGIAASETTNNDTTTIDSVRELTLYLLESIMVF
jgi:hypothetical protein